MNDDRAERGAGVAALAFAFEAGEITAFDGMLLWAASIIIEGTTEAWCLSGPCVSARTRERASESDVDALKRTIIANRLWQEPALAGLYAVYRQGGEAFERAVLRSIEGPTPTLELFANRVLEERQRLLREEDPAC